MESARWEARRVALRVVFPPLVIPEARERFGATLLERKISPGSQHGIRNCARCSTEYLRTLARFN
jgi:hypothetical protein